MILNSLNTAIEVVALDQAVLVLAHLRTIRVHVVTLTMGVFDDSEAVLLDLLDRAIREYALFFAICEQAFNSAVREADLLSPIWEMLLDLIVLKFENLEAVGESRLCRLRLREEIYDFTTWERLFDVLVLEENDLVAIEPNLTLDTVRENYLFLSTLVEFLTLSFLTDNLIDQDQVLIGLI